ncbi:hypothetical protein AN958_11958 [Leucoagaricus sp. SymC.cos]|nr:hypothetical protein AN958_11958 [Leucoagaricus sp. SymC.cos]
MTAWNSRQRRAIEITKSANYPMPFWQRQDAEHEEQQKVERRMQKLGELGHNAPVKQGSSSKPRRAYLSPTLQVVVDSSLDDDNAAKSTSEKDIPMDLDGSPEPPTQPPRAARIKLSGGLPPRRNLATGMAARKRKWPTKNTTLSDSDSGSSSSSSNSDSESSNSVIELTDSESEKETTEKEHKPAPEVPSDSEIVIIEPPPPRITIPLLQIAPVAPHVPTTPPRPSEELVKALDETCGGLIRMQATKQLPFLLRNLRRGFHLRCNSIGVKTSRSKPRMPIVTRYEYTEKIFETKMSKWFCPLCELHGAFPNREMLRCHLHWDHPEVILERWERRMNNQGMAEWRIHLLTPEVIHEMVHPRSYDLLAKMEPQESSVEPEAHLTATPRSTAAPEEHSDSSLDLLSLPSSSRPTSQAPSEPPETRDVTPTDSKLGIIRKLEHIEPTNIKALQDLTPRQGRTSTTPSWYSRSRSINTDISQETTQSLSTIRIEHSPGPPGGMYPSPPPQHDPLGPAAQAPLLPAKSEYDGPDIYFSSRPGGATTFDLLSTLPMEPFGVLSWDIIEREEEIYESDDVKVEYKVMHALWMRWMMLNRTVFMQNYYKGTMAFIDAYWRMIHQAAGWKAMRYWLIILLETRFLTGREVAKALKHYENLTGMTHWGWF